MKNKIFLFFFLCSLSFLQINGMEKDDVPAKPSEQIARQVLDFIQTNKLDSLKKLSDTNPVSFNFFYGADAVSPLSHAATYCHLDCVNYILEQGAIVDDFVTSQIHQYFSLQEIISNLSDYKIPEKTMASIKASQRIFKGPTALHCACGNISGTMPEEKVLAIVKTLLDHRADPNLECYDIREKIALMLPSKPSTFAEHYGYLHVATLLRQSETTILKRDDDLKSLVSLKENSQLEDTSQMDYSASTNKEIRVKKSYIAMLMKEQFAANIKLLNQLEKKASRPPSEYTSFENIVDRTSMANIVTYIQSLLPPEVSSNLESDFKKTTHLSLSAKLIRIYFQCFPSQNMIEKAKKIQEELRPDEKKNEK